MTTTDDTVSALESFADHQPIVDPETLRDTSVPFHEDRDVVEQDVFETVAELGDLAPVGVRNDDGEILFMRVTDTCERKIPSAAVDPDDGFGQAATDWVETCTGRTIELDGIVGVWSYEVRLEDTERTASRYFVTFSGSLADGEQSTPIPTADTPAEGAAFEAGWYAGMPGDAVPAPGTDHFFE